MRSPRPDQPVQPQLARLASLEAQPILRRIGSNTAKLETTIHAARVAAKRLRAWWRLLRPVAADDTPWREDRRLRRAAGALSRHRDAHVLDQAMKALTKRAGAASIRRALRSARAAMATRTRDPSGDNAAARGALVRAGAALRASAAAMGSARIHGKGWDILQPGLRQNHRRARRTMRRLDLDAPAEAFHTWRKQVKRLLHQVEPLTATWPQRERRWRDKLDRLGRLLGEDHDLHLLEDRLRSTHDPGVKEVLGLLRRRSRQLRRRALELGQKVFSVGSDAFVRRLGRPWRDRT